MNGDDRRKTRAQLIDELAALRQRIAELEARRAGGGAARASETEGERLRQVIQSMPVMMLAFNESRTSIIVWNRECERVTGYSAEEIVGNPDAPRLLYPDLAYLYRLRDLWRESGDDYRDVEWQITCKDGSVRTTAWSNISDRFPIPGWGTWAIGVDITDRKRAEEALRAAHDELERRVAERTADLATANAQLQAQITVRKMAEQALRQSEERLRTVLEHMPVMLIAYDMEANSIVFWNRECERVTGYSAQEIVGKPATLVNRMLYPNKAYLHRLWGEMLERGDDYRDWEWEWACKDGSFKTIAWSNISDRVPIPGWGTWAIGVDVTERKRAEERAIELAVEQERVKLLERFIGDASHDLKTPLMSMKFSLGVLRKTGDLQQRQRHLDILDVQVRHLEQVLEDLLSIVRLEKESGLEYKPFDLNRLLRGIVAEHEPLAAQKALALEFCPAAATLPIRGDAMQLDRAIANLVINALNYTPPGGAVTVRSFTRDRWACVQVQDTGIGISREDLPHIFKRFFRADQARSTNTGGMGLGLAITRKIVEAHQGTIEVESAPGAGSTFTVRLPLPDGTEAEDSSP